MDDELRNFLRHFKPPNSAQLANNAKTIGRIGKAVEHVMMRKYSNNAHPSVDTLELAWNVLLLAECLCLAGAPKPGQVKSLRIQMEALAWRLGDEDARWP